MHHGLVSIITPTCNHERYISKCLQSVEEQSYQDWEQIIIDDGSTDRTPEVVARHTERRRTYLRQQNLGIFRLAETYNRALSMVTGEYIAILEGDDYWQPSTLSLLVNAMRDPSVVLAYGYAAITNAHGVATSRTVPSATVIKRLGTTKDNTPVGSASLAMASYWGRTFTFPCALLLRRSALDAIGGFQGVTSMPFIDFPTLLEISALGAFRFLPQVTGYWRQHRANATRNRSEADVMSRVRDYGFAFLERERCRLGFTDRQLVKVRSSWIEASALIAFDTGRRLLLAGEWKEARTQFRQAFAHGRGSTRLRAVAGYTCALAHRNIEWLARLTRGKEADINWLVGK